MELRHLRYFIAVAEQENVSRAALKLHLSQPALSRQIRDLEDEIGFQLLERSAKSVRLTEAGRQFLADARAVLQRADEAVQAARAIATGGAGELHLGYAPSLTTRILPPALHAFQSAWPKVRPRLHDFSTEEMLAGLRDGRLDIAFIVRPTPAMSRGLRFEELARESMRVAVAPKHPLARRRALTLDEVQREALIVYSKKDYPEYHELLAAIFGAIDRKPRIAEEHDSVTSLIAAVEACSGVALVSESIGCLAGTRLKLIPLSPAPKPFVIGAVWKQDRLSPAAERFLECVKKTLVKEHKAPTYARRGASN